MMNEMPMRQKVKYPKSVFFIISNEFCERFSYYGMRTVLSLYLLNMLGYSESTSTIIYHVFSSLVYFFPLLGAIISDSWLGKFNTILYLSIIYSLGQVILSLSAATPIGLPAKEFAILGLILIAVGTGGIKPCVSAFGGDQFVLPQQEKQLAMFFSIFYFSINTGSLISTILTPVIRKTECFGADCYFVAFLVPAVLMIISIVVFVTGKRMYKMVNPTGNLIVKVSKCVCHAIYNKIKSKGEKRDHWLDHADDVYDNKLIEDIKVVLRVLKLFVPLPIFWALYDQQGSQWTFQATRMDGQIGSITILPDQLQAVNPLLIMIFIPIFETGIYPIFAKIHFINTPLKKLVVGGLLASVAFVAAGIVEIELEKTYPQLPTNGSAQIRIFNTMNCTVNVHLNEVNLDQKNVINPLNMSEVLEVKINESIKDISYTIDFEDCYDNGYILKNNEGIVSVEEASATSWVITPLGLYSYKDRVNKPENGKPMVRSVIYLESESNATLKLLRKDENETVVSIPVSFHFSESELKEIEDPSEYDVYLDETLLDKNVPFKSGGVYTVIGSKVMYNNKPKILGKTVTVTPPNSLHMAWMLPQYIIITMAEVMFSVTGLQFAFTQAPASMKSLLQAGWLLSVAFGNLIVVIVKGSHPFERLVYEIFLYAGLMAVVMVIFGIMTIFYKYVEIPEEKDNDVAISLEEKNGNVNLAYKDDEKR
ncbi:PREDICTED: peptide transporter family 2-like isoform X2 [Trachymyrmex septentrionalis]|uniref:peptide transporter family 2-like isoform X2 n=1 Tax=Trachymyrmex septentrionalis TaxID=34720 RepID=UPI00084F1258|nr:PREDICTED: peptide transporter family 2-like isoform X2 [Trachymyrmex septentrionalis]